MRPKYVLHEIIIFWFLNLRTSSCTQEAQKLFFLFLNWSKYKHFCASWVHINLWENIWCKYIGHTRITPPVTRVTFLYLETLEILFEKNFLNKKCFFIVGQHFGNIFLLWQQIATKNNKCGKFGVVAFGRSNIKNEIWIL